MLAVIGINKVFHNAKDEKKMGYLRYAGINFFILIILKLYCYLSFNGIWLNSSICSFIRKTQIPNPTKKKLMTELDK
jgi:hypothetical protein